MGDEFDKHAVAQAATVHVNAVEHDDLVSHVQAASDKAEKAGDAGTADKLRKLAEKHHERPQALKDQLIALVTAHPDALHHFKPRFARDILKASTGNGKSGA
jgi:hypothetical protein